MPLARPLNVLFLCTGNSARSIMSEAMLRHLGGGRFVAYSAGSTPAGYVNRFALEQIAARGWPTDGYRSKSWDEFAAGPKNPDAPAIDIVITVCGNAAAETCPVFPGAGVSAYWGVPDPAPIEGNTARMQLNFAQAYAALERRIKALIALPDAVLADRKALKRELDRIGTL
ncbi:MAG: arsenate reductase ArsC [Rhodospirillaceae bacterium]|nr:arsenate reductase ArsC [Rhodospirillaceae bacterium]